MNAGHLVLAAAIVCAFVASGRGQAATQDELKLELERLRRILPRSDPWEQWLTQTGELPPDFDSMPSIPDLPELLVLEENGRTRPVANEADWRIKREQIKQLFHRYVIGTVPPPPGNVRAKVLSAREEPGATVQMLQLEFGPNYAATLRVELLIPKGKGPFPVFMTQWNHRGWALIALSRGYIGCVYAGADSLDDAVRFSDAYPQYDWSKLTRRAWAAGRCIDYLETLPVADTSRIVLTGHSRNGKQSLIASALDERISCVISSSSGAGGASPYRLYSEEQFGEGIELLTRVFPDWFHPRLRFFAGRENKLPVDSNGLIAMSAPRPCLITTALNDGVESTWANEQAYLSAKRVYRLLGHEERIRIDYRPGGHETRAGDIERYLDWCDTQFGRGSYQFPEVLYHPYDFAAWRKASGVTISPEDYPALGLQDPLTSAAKPIRSAVEWQAARAAIRERILVLQGEASPRAAGSAGSYGAEAAKVAADLGRSSAGSGLEKASLNFGDYIAGDVYYPTGLADSGKKAPAIIWLHPNSCPSGYVASYRRGEQAFRTMAQQGFAVFCFDQIGFGTRQEERRRFYERYPHWSLLGKMVRDAQAALDVTVGLKYVDPDKVYCVGYGLGGFVGLHLAALDDRITGVASVCGFTPMRLDKPEKGTGGIARYCMSYGLLPQLGFFIGHEERIPYDFHEVLALIAPRPTLVVAPQLDREATLADVKTCVESARKVYALLDSEGKLEIETPEDYNRFGPEMQAIVNRWLGRVAGLSR